MPRRLGDHRLRGLPGVAREDPARRGFSREQVHEGLRIAAVVHAAAVALDAEAALELNSRDVGV